MSLKTLASLGLISFCLSNPLWSQTKFHELSLSFGSLQKYPLESRINPPQNKNNHIPIFNSQLAWTHYKKVKTPRPLYHAYSLASQYRGYQNSSFAFRLEDYMAYNYGYVSNTPVHTSILTEMQQLNLDLAYGLRYGALVPYKPGERSKLSFGIDFHLAMPVFLKQKFTHISNEKIEQQLNQVLYSKYVDLILEASLRWHFKLNEQAYLGLIISTNGLLSNLNQASYLGTITAGISYIYL